MFMNLIEFKNKWNPILNEKINDPEAYHSEYDDMIEERLKELEPEFFNELPYKCDSRWCA